MGGLLSVAVIALPLFNNLRFSTSRKHRLKVTSENESGLYLSLYAPTQDQQDSQKDRGLSHPVLHEPQVCSQQNPKGNRSPNLHDPSQDAVEECSPGHTRHSCGECPEGSHARNEAGQENMLTRLVPPSWNGAGTAPPDVQRRRKGGKERGNEGRSVKTRAGPQHAGSQRRR
jgi:hypothetical protein